LSHEIDTNDIRIELFAPLYDKIDSHFDRIREIILSGKEDKALTIKTSVEQLSELLKYEVGFIVKIDCYPSIHEILESMVNLLLCMFSDPSITLLLAVLAFKLGGTSGLLSQTWLKSLNTYLLSMQVYISKYESCFFKDEKNNFSDLRNTLQRAIIAKLNILEALYTPQALSTDDQTLQDLQLKIFSLINKIKKDEDKTSLFELSGLFTLITLIDSLTKGDASIYILIPILHLFSSKDQYILIYT